MALRGRKGVGGRGVGGKEGIWEGGYFGGELSFTNMEVLISNSSKSCKFELVCIFFMHMTQGSYWVLKAPFVISKYHHIYVYVIRKKGSDFFFV